MKPTKNKIFLSIAGLLIAVSAWFIGQAKDINLSGGSGGQYARTCTVNTVAVALVGHQVSRTILSSYGLRAWARIQQPINATNTVQLAFDEGNAATLNSGLTLYAPQANGSTTITHIDFGLNTDFPYTGEVTGITNVGSTTVFITECRY